MVIRKKRFFRRKSNKGAVAKIAKRVYWQQEARSKESKFFDVNQGSLAVPTTGTLQSITQIPSGTGVSQRIGTELFLKGLYLNAKVEIPTNADDFVNQMRIIVLQWLPDDGQEPPAITGGISGILETASFLAPYNNNNSDKYRILKDKQVTLSREGPSVKYFKILLKFSRYRRFGVNLKPKWTTSTTGTGMIYVAFISDSGSAPHPTQQFASRVTYYDD